MDTATIQSLIASFIGFFVVLYFSQHDEENSFGRSIFISLIMSALVLLLDLGNIGLIAAIILAFLILLLIQKYSYWSAILVIAVGGFLSYLIELGIQRYFI